jgi:hypothetical protein
MCVTTHSVNPDYHVILFGFVPGGTSVWNDEKKTVSTVTYSLKT